MAITNPFSIAWGGVTVGGSSNTYLLHNPYVIDKTFTALRLTFDVVVIGTDHADLKSKSDALEVEFRKRSQNLVITLGAASWTYTAGTHLLNGTAQCVKSGDPTVDMGVARKYTCSITGELPADDANGLRELHVQVKYEPGRQKIVSMSGTYTSLAGSPASTVYLANFDGVASGILTAVGVSNPELVAEDYTRDRLNALCQFTRQYVDLLYNQSESALDSNKVRAHRVVFTNLSSHPGDSQEGVYRLRRVQASYDAYADVGVTTDLQALVKDVCLPFLRKQFRAEFDPKVFTIEDRREQYDETAKRVGLSVTFVYQPGDGGDVVEVALSEGFREQRQIDYTYVHDGGELSAYADPGFLTLERTKQRTVIVLGEESPRRRLAQDDDKSAKGGAGSLNIEAPQKVQKAGWNRISNTSQVTPQWIGEPGEEQVRVTVLTESVVERYNEAPGEGTGGGGPVVTEPT